MTTPTEPRHVEARLQRLEQHAGLPPYEPAPDPGAEPGTYTVRSGDTLSKIASLFRVSVDDLARWNAIVDRNVIRIGQILRLTAPDPGPDPDPAPDPEPPAPQPAPGAPPAPGNLRATIDQKERTVLLAWGAVPGATYRVYETDSPAGFGPIEGTSSLRGPLGGNRTYEYTVTAVVDGRESQRSNEVVVALADAAAPAPAPSPKPTPAPSPAPTPPGGSPIPADAVLLLDGRFATTGFEAYDNMQNRGHNGDPDSYRGDRTVLVDDPVKGKVCRFTVSPGDVPNYGGGERSELASHLAEARTREGDERWYEFSVMFGHGFRAPSSEWCIWMQWHPGSGSPPFTLSVLQSGKVSVFDMWENPEILADTTDNGVWHDYVVHARFSNRADGWVEAWRDGKLVVPRTNHQTMNSASNYLKLGLYRDRESHTQVVYHTGVRIYAP